jgi:type I restriction enzyme S subunit
MSDVINNVPELRFLGYSLPWVKNKLGSFGVLVSGLTYSPDNIVQDGLLVLRSSNIQNSQIALTDNVYVDIDVAENNLTRKDDILICVRNGSKRLIGKNTLIPEGIPQATHGAFMTIFRGENNKFIYQWMQTEKYFKEVHKNLGATINSINGSDLKKFPVIVSDNLEEQQKIADFLSSVDKKIEQLTEKHRLLTEYKKGVMQQIFTQQIRFKDNQGNDYPGWGNKRLGSISKRKTEKNKDEAQRLVLTNSAIQGIVSQTDYFDKDIANQNNLGGYYIVEQDDFVYNPRISVSAPVGPIKRNHLSTGVMSPLYSVFAITKGSKDFFERYFETNLWHRYMNQIANFGARHDRMNVTTADFYSMPMPFPCIDEQQKIANFLTEIDNKIDHAWSTLEQTKAFKKGLLQQMFV